MREQPPMTSDKAMRAETGVPVGILRTVARRIQDHEAALDRLEDGAPGWTGRDWAGQRWTWRGEPRPSGGGPNGPEQTGVDSECQRVSEALAPNRRGTELTLVMVERERRDDA